MRTRKPFLVFLLIAVLHGAQASDAPLSRPLTVGVMVSPPFVMLDGEGGYAGLAIDLRETVAREMGVKYSYLQYSNWERFILAVRVGEVDVAVSNITVIGGDHSAA